LRGTTTGDRGTIDIFSTNASAMASPGFCRPLGRPAPGVADMQRLPTQEAVKRKLQPTRPFPQPLPRRARRYQKSDAALPWGRTLGHGTSAVRPVPRYRN